MLTIAGGIILAVICLAIAPYFIYAGLFVLANIATAIQGIIAAANKVKTARPSLRRPDR